MHRRVTSFMMAVAGLLFFMMFVSQDVRIHPELAWSDLPWSLILRYAIAMVLGGTLSGFLFSGLFGRNGLLGWVLALLGGIVAALISGFFGSAFGLLPDLLADGYSTSDLVMAALGALIVPLSVIEQPWLIFVLLAIVATTHVWAKRARHA